MGFWDKVNKVSNTPQKDAKSEALREIGIQKRIAGGEKVMRKKNEVESWFASGNCRPKVTNISFLCDANNSIEVGSEGPMGLLNLMQESINNGDLDKELADLQAAMDRRSTALKKAKG